MRSMLRGALTLACFIGLIGVAAAQGYPNKPVKVMVAFPAGGSADIVARILTQKLAEQMNQAFVVDNKPGAGGNIAFDAAARADPDGYTLLLSTPGVVMNPTLYQKSARFTPDDFAGVYLIGEAPLLIMAHPGFKANTLQELIAVAKQKPDSVRYASAGSGSSSHLATEIFRHMAGLQMVHVPYKGGGPAFQDVINGNVDITSLPIAESLPMVASGRVRALAQTGTSRSSMAPDIPTVAEAGVPGYSLTTWYVLLAPAKTPPEIVSRLAAEMDKAVKTPEVREKLQKSGVDVIGHGPERTTSFMKGEFTKYAKLLKESGAQVE
jgi:tripartite-type tricarboxylate transporter receptor subunit TctC